ncbi:MAG: hypothetical protein R8G66_09110 [Cytophagales bacterium]|nr:hypothetical protein [Cytophagales bacterium]
MMQKFKLDSIRSVATIITNNGEGLMDTRRRISSGIYQLDTNKIIRSINLSVEELLINDLNHHLVIDMMNMEPWDSTSQTPLKVDSAFYLSEVSHVALSKITLGDVTNEILFPVWVHQDSLTSFIEGKTTLALKNWGLDLPENHQLYLGLSLFTLSEN